MIIEIPDEYLGPIRDMPIIPQSEKYVYVKNGDALEWIEGTDKLCVAQVIVCRAIMKRAEDLGLIIHDPATRTWRGVDVDGD